MHIYIDFPIIYRLGRKAELGAGLASRTAGWALGLARGLGQRAGLGGWAGLLGCPGHSQRINI